VIGCPLHSPPCTLLPPNRGPTLAHGRHSSTPGLVRRQSSEGAGRRWRCGQTRLHRSRWERPCPPPPCSHPAHPPTVQPQLIRAGPQGIRGQVGAYCRRCTHRDRPTPLPTWDCRHIRRWFIGSDGGWRGEFTSHWRRSAHITAQSHTLAACQNTPGKSSAPKRMSNDWGGQMIILGAKLRGSAHPSESAPRSMALRTPHSAPCATLWLGAGPCGRA